MAGGGLSFPAHRVAGHQLAIRRGAELGGTGLPERHPVRVSVLKTIGARAFDHTTRNGTTTKGATTYPSVHGVAGPLRCHFRAILLHHCYTGVQCHRERTYVNRRKSLQKEVPEVGLEPTRPNGHWILNPARLPIPPLSASRLPATSCAKIADPEASDPRKYPPHGSGTTLPHGTHLRAVTHSCLPPERVAPRRYGSEKVYFIGPAS